jgi:hypothetical protein
LLKLNKGYSANIASLETGLVRPRWSLHEISKLNRLQSKSTYFLLTSARPGTKSIDATLSSSLVYITSAMPLLSHDVIEPASSPTDETRLRSLSASETPIGTRLGRPSRYNSDPQFGYHCQ